MHVCRVAGQVGMDMSSLTVIEALRDHYDRAVHGTAPRPIRRTCREH
jgi:hypothetical protein